MRRLFSMVLLTAGLFSFASASQARTTTKDITCSSIDRQYSECYVGKRIMSVSLTKRHSEAKCYNWGYTNDSVWVDDGCRASFRVTLNERSGGLERTKISCSSKDFEYSDCYVGGRIVSASLSSRQSETSCSGKWGYEGSIIWVDRGCRATFNVTYRRR